VGPRAAVDAVVKKKIPFIIHGLIKIWMLSQGSVHCLTLYGTNDSLKIQARINMFI
jgi:hypothetical protein